MCQADIPWPDQCNSCLQAATAGAASACPLSKNASAVYRGCVFQYSDTLIAAVADTSIAYITQNHAANVPETVTFQQTRTELFTALSGAASISPLKLASSNRTFNGTHTLYGLAQCNRYLPADECSKCIKSLVTLLPATVLLSEGVSVTGFSCYIRYDLTPFGIYNPSATAGEVPVAALHNLNDGSRIHQAEIIGILVSVSIIVLLAVIMVARHYIRTRKLAQLKEITGLIEFSYHQIKQGTESFNEETNKLGEGGFGQVYKGKFHIKGEEMDVAVKRVTDQTAAKQLLDELSVLAKLVHKNVVQLVGFCTDDMWSCFGKKKLYICNELMSNGSLDKHIFFDSEENGRKPLSWSSRYEIIRGICDGLQYIHGYCNKKISHMDIKPSNILLDEGMVPKIADFGLSRVFKTKDISQKVTQNVIGSQGYIAPEYINHGIVGRKCDIYSLGILILAIVMGTGPQGRIDPCDSPEVGC
ncbi:cysteine-rich receptor-like protein kinase 25 isoform X2 [Phragmites australis]|uniref:cysteine-rich receptor-like protein kinase 25 isoform X2 n=1 Tax=Phragmites australis TaxID=29695 RepID=UPI002D7901D5|nr:cysteine-rich receptor-like protein kinase 25 isoform X2 [Phragmites australis]